MRPFSLHHLTALDLTTGELVELAAELDCAHVCLFTHQPGDGVGIPVVRDGDVEALKREMNDAGITAYGITSFPLLPYTDPSGYEAGLDRGARLGASRANTRILDPDERRATDNFAVFAELCGRSNLLPCIEFCGFGHIDALPQAVRIVRETGAGMLTLDPLHIARTGTPWPMLRQLDRRLIGYAQICDGLLAATEADYEREQPFDRLPAGDGEFPLAEFLSLVPDDLALSVEVPCLRLREQGFGSREAAAEIMRRTREHLGALGFD